MKCEKYTKCLSLLALFKNQLTLSKENYRKKYQEKENSFNSYEMRFIFQKENILANFP